MASAEAGIPSTTQGGAETPTLTFLIADDHEAFRAGTAAELGARGFVSVGEAVTAGGAVELAVREQPLVCLIGLDLPGNGLSAVARIAKRLPTATIVVLSETSDRSDVLASLERGAAGFLLKSVTGDELATTLRAAYHGEPALSRALVPFLVDQVRRGKRRRLVLPTRTISLTAREWDVGEMLRDGRGTDEIASRLGLSPVTVRRHAALLMRKMGAPDRESAIEALRMFAR